jgi:hypothetical protein
MNPNTTILVSEVHGRATKSTTQHMTYTSQGASHDSNETASVGGKYDSMNEDGPNGSPYEMLVKHDQSEMNVTPKGSGCSESASNLSEPEIPRYLHNVESATSWAT